jgi:hypothetical protein
MAPRTAISSPIGTRAASALMKASLMQKQAIAAIISSAARRL